MTRPLAPRCAPRFPDNRSSRRCLWVSWPRRHSPRR